MKLKSPCIRFLNAVMAALLISLCPGCTLGLVTKSKPTEIALGMTPAEVMAQMGTPLSVSASGNEQVLKYNVAHSRAMPILAGWESYTFRFIDGKLVSFGSEKDSSWDW